MIPANPKDFSKEIPCLQTTWSSNSLGLLKTCPRKYMYEKVMGLRAKRKSIHLEFGGHYADALEHYHLEKAKAGGDHEQALHSTVRFLLAKGERSESGQFTPWNSDPEDKDHNLKNRFTLVRAIVWHLEQFADDPAVTVILSSGKPAVELEFRFGIGASAPDGTEYQLYGFIDRLVKFGADIFVSDNKTTKSALGEHFFKQFTPGNQVSMYSTAGKVVFDGTIKGVIIDAVQMAVGFSRFSRHIAQRTTAQLEEWMRDTIRHLRNAERYASEEYWPMNDTACDKFGGCTFREICGADPGVRDLYLRSKFEVRVTEAEMLEPE